MGDALMNDDQLDSIADQVKEKMILWMDERHIYPFPQKNQDIDTQLLERMVRVEEGIKHQNENLEKMMIQSDRRFTILSETMDKRFEAVDKRFEAIDIRFNRLYTFLSGIFLTILAGMITLIIQNLQG
ncbi:MULTISPECIES: hypothetical protein [unclassified Oceanispirochaeta]|uniref:hypothetical protein n=1 Tax=unclassified Oceanispirochaeta TaxID=2635722 RepID=UPI000E0960C4|nr:MULTISPECIES: hypothetical protein [unclassified Oceanispirochaeta]MBF9018901.1 hypothetical protein [Oceanispirochaeta sp. M2]NPD75400.1 hypothetical protein [Oceanispirochaeta sp. M1]RDG28742.1 hypothetical protein DV872_25225 [Oceanispirochaeta sp. M1]